MVMLRIRITQKWSSLQKCKYQNRMVVLEPSMFGLVRGILAKGLLTNN
jgi:hypothetical protein